MRVTTSGGAITAMALIVLGGCASGLFEDQGPDARMVDAPVPDAVVPPDAVVIDAPPIDAPAVVQRLGHVTPLGEQSSHGPNFLLGEQLVVPSTVTLQQFGVLMISGGPQLQMALYTNAGGAPANLVAQTPIVTTTAGTMEINPTASGVVLAPGTYWIVGIVNITASIGYTTQAGSNVVQYRSLTFGSPLPSPFGSVTTYTGQSFNYWIVVQ